jgi:hypothetical protein
MRRVIPLIFFLLIVIGVILIINGYMEYTAAQGTSSTPKQIELNTLEQGATLMNNYVIIGPHWRLYPAAVYHYTIPKSATSQDPKPEYTVAGTYYPIISDQHPFMVQLRSLAEKYGAAEAIPNSEVPNLTDFTVLVKTFEFPTIGAIPNEISKADKVEGLVINRIAMLNSKEKELIAQNFPQLDFSKIYVVEAGRKPTSTSQAVSMMVGGLGLILISAVVGFILYRRPKSKKSIPASA